MSDDKKLQVSSSVDAYRRGIQERAARAKEERKKNRPPIPNLAQADAAFDPRKQSPTTLANMGAQQAAIESGEAKPAGLSDETVAGMKELHAAMAKKRETSPQAPPEEPSVPAPPQPLDEAVKKDNAELKRRMDELDDLEFERRMDNIRRDVINNVEEKEAIERILEEGGKRYEMNVEDGLVSGVYEQTVPIHKDLTVRFRTVSPMETREMRVLLWEWADKDPRIENLAADIYGMMMVVAATKMIGTNELPTHLKGDSLYNYEFDKDAFEIKYNYMDRLPGPLVHAIGVHGHWFDERVRKLFTQEKLKDF